jgi:abnormal spindle-like microcephaly-associated protein
MKSKIKAIVQCQAYTRRHAVLQKKKLAMACAVSIQRIWRGFLAVIDYTYYRQAIIAIQCLFRHNAARMLSTKRMQSVLCVQRGARCWIAVRSVNALRGQQEEQVRLESAIVRCQACTRRHLVLRKKKLAIASAVSIQRIWRGFLAFIEYFHSQQDIIVVQSLFRRNAAQTHSTRRMQSIIRLQSGMRYCIAVRYVNALRGQRKEEIRTETIHRIFSATRLQAAYRSHVVRRELRVLAIHTTTIQRCWRAFIARLDYEVYLIDVTLVQSVVRGWSARTKWKTQQKSVLMIQNFIRVCLAQNETERLRLIQHEANCELLRFNEAARMIQKTWRCYNVHVDYMLLIISAITVQALFRRRQAAVKSRSVRQGIVTLQSLARGAAERSIQKRREECAIVIQARVRTFYSESAFRRHILAAVSIQRLARGLLTRIDMDLNHFAACEVQRIWRGYQRNVEFVMQVIAAITIQSAFRLALAKRKVLEICNDKFLESIEMLFQEKKAIVVQRAFRAYIQFRTAVEAACILQAAARGFLCRQKVLKIDFGVVVLQSIVRGRLARRRRPKQARVIATRLAGANMRARQNPNMRLGVRTASALVVLQDSIRLAEIMNAVATLETSTRLSRNCCIAFAECNAPEIVYSLIRTCNRSLPHVELLHYVLLTLMNVASHKELLWRVFSDDSVDIFMDLVQMFRDKDNVFNLATSLLHNAVLSNSDLKNRCATSENIKRMKGVHSLCARKLSLTTTRVSRASRRSVGSLDKKQGVHVLKNIIHLLEK